jgi:hypothetical protein
MQRARGHAVARDFLAGAEEARRDAALGSQNLRDDRSPIPKHARPRRERLSIVLPAAIMIDPHTARASEHA